MVGGKSAVTVALQLLKRNRNIRWAKREGRMPASVMLSCLALDVAEVGHTIGENLRIITLHILDRLLSAQRSGNLIRVENPRCQGDIFTDRWPENYVSQNTMIDDMQLFLQHLNILFDEQMSLQIRMDTLKAMFGEDIGQAVVNELGEHLGQAIQTGRHGFGALGGVVISPAAAARAKPAIKPSTFYGSKWPSA